MTLKRGKRSLTITESGTI